MRAVTPFPSHSEVQSGLASCKELGFFHLTAGDLQGELDQQKVVQAGIHPFFFVLGANLKSTSYTPLQIQNGSLYLGLGEWGIHPHKHPQF